MKVYLFNLETGIYLGEDFADEAPMEMGTFVVPPDATTVKPPEVGHGQILVFIPGEQRWKVQGDMQPEKI